MVPATVSAIGVATVNARAQGRQHWELWLMLLLSHSSRVEGKLYWFPFPWLPMALPHPSAPASRDMRARDGFLHPAYPSY